jgi:hypothetical protein
MCRTTAPAAAVAEDDDPGCEADDDEGGDRTSTRVWKSWMNRGLAKVISPCISITCPHRSSAAAITCRVASSWMEDATITGVLLLSSPLPPRRRPRRGMRR